MGPLFPLALIPYALALYGLDRLFLRRERSVRSLVLLNALVGLAFFAVLAVSIGWAHLGAVIFAAVLCLWLTVRGSGLAIAPPTMPRVILSLDGSLLVLILFVAYGAAVQVPAYQLIPACVGCAGSLLGLMIRRTGGGLGARGWAFVVLVFLAILGLVFLLVDLAAAPAGQGVVALWSALAAAAQFVSDLLLRALMWFISLFPAPAQEEVLEVTPIQVERPEDVEMAAGDHTVMVVLLVAGVLFLLFCGLRALGKLRIGGVKNVAPASRARRGRLSLLGALRRLLSSWAEQFRLRVWLFRARSSPAGLFYLLVHRCRRGPWHKRQGETPREFLLRLRRSAEGDPELAAALDALIPAVDAALYAPSGGGGPFSHAALVRRRIGASLRRQFLQDGLERLPWHRARSRADSPS